MKRVFALLSVIIITNSAWGAQYRAALVADMDTGRVLYSENANVPNYPASLTKIMTLYLTFDALVAGRLHLDDYLIVSASAAGAEPVKLGLTAGSKISVEDAIKAVAVVSANDVARVLAENLKGGKEGNFADLMTRVANEIGLTNTNFENSSGLPNDDHMSTARDIALLSMAVYKHFPQYWKYFGIRTWSYNGKTYTNGNRLLGSYPGCDGMKTGFTNKSRYSLVATAERDDRHLMAVLLGAENKDVRANVAAQLLNRGFAMPDGTSGIVKQTAVPAHAETKSNYAPSPQPVTQPQTFASAYQVATAQPTPTAAGGASGGVGVQFGAFSSYDNAASMAARVKNTLGVVAHVEQAGSLYRVRATGMGEGAAQKLKQSAIANGIDCFVFH